MRRPSSPTFGNRTIGTFQGAFDAMVVIWSNLPRAIGDLTIQAANALIAGLESMLNGAVDGINALLEGVNAGLAAIGIERAIELVPDVDLGRIENEFAGAASRAGNAARDAFAAAFETDTFARPDPAQQRLVPALAFAGAPRFHDGGVAGLRADEVPAILQRGEMVLSRAQLAAIGAARETRPPVNVVMNISTPDAGSFRYAQGQIAADAARAMERARRNL